ncbi:hypothetical protein EXE30_05700 [Acinetobacter halotolerans]|uniref:Sulfurtransferase complex subunit TusB n=1 Tax=Acinetobacter halotolerans TaxID=1752076 RepID=A0A4Q6XDJ3_9GAMM|nr:hypothetical protein [Acinetobacter halotolerans]RZF54716.1 hypothetical protein EXE30_05700 [Acinetobacter halotolerans]
MKTNTLFLIQSPYSQLDKMWADVCQMAQADDSIVIMGDAALYIPQTILDRFSHLYCLSSEQSLLNVEIKEHVKIIEYTQFADLVLQFDRCVTLK